MSALSLLKDPKRYLFFTGKGGVGKTSLSCAVALSLSDHGKRVLLVRYPIPPPTLTRC